MTRLVRWAAAALVLVAGAAALSETVNLVGNPPETTVADFTTAVASCANQRIVVASSQTVASNTSVPESCDVEFEGAGALSINNAIVLTVNGQILAPKRRIFTGPGTATFPCGSQTRVLYPEWWGAVADGTTDDTEAVQKALDAGAAEGSAYEFTLPMRIGAVTVTDPHRIRLTHGTLSLTSTLTWRGGSGGGISGHGPSATRLLWIGNQRDPALLVDDSWGTLFEGFSIKASAAPSACSAVGCRLWDGVVLINGNLEATTPGNRTFRGIVVDGNTTGLLHTGFLYAAPQSDGCTGDKDPWWICSGANTFASASGQCCTTAAATSCSAAERCDRDNGVAGGTPCPGNAGRTLCVLGKNANNDFDVYEHVTVTNGMRNTDCTGAGTPAACCTGTLGTSTCGSSGWRIEPTQSVAHSLADCHFHHQRIGVTTLTPVGGGGSFSWSRGGGGSSSFADFAFATSTRAVEVVGFDSENSLAFVKTGSPSSGVMPTLIAQNRWATDAVVANGDCAASGDPQECCTALDTGTCDEVVTWQNRGPLVFNGNTFTQSGTSKSIRIMARALKDPDSFVAVGNGVKTSVAVDGVFATHDTTEHWTLRSNFRNLDATVDAIPDIEFWQPTLFANLGTPPNGTVRYCGDCTKSTPCASGGTGAFARRLNAAWDCDA
jgi:hypothetical protein